MKNSAQPIKVEDYAMPFYPVPEFKLTLHWADKKRPAEIIKVSSSRDCFDAIRKIFEADGLLEWREQFILVALNRPNKVIGFFRVSTGGVSSTVADPKIIFQLCLMCSASGFIVAHNHPSGNRTASQSDIDLTRKLKEGAKLLELQLLDHVIVCGDKYFSFADEGIL